MEKSYDYSTEIRKPNTIKNIVDRIWEVLGGNMERGINVLLSSSYIIQVRSYSLKLKQYKIKVFIYYVKLWRWSIEENNKKFI